MTTLGSDFFNDMRVSYIEEENTFYFFDSFEDQGWFLFDHVFREDGYCVKEEESGRKRKKYVGLYAFNGEEWDEFASGTGRSIKLAEADAYREMGMEYGEYYWRNDLSGHDMKQITNLINVGYVNRGDFKQFMGGTRRIDEVEVPSRKPATRSKKYARVVLFPPRVFDGESVERLSAQTREQ